MTNYSHRLDRIEANLTPDRGSPHMVWLDARRSPERAVAAYAEARGLAAADVRANALFVHWQAADNRLCPEAP